MVWCSKSLCMLLSLLHQFGKCYYCQAADGKTCWEQLDCPGTPPSEGQDLNWGPPPPPRFTAPSQPLRCTSSLTVHCLLSSCHCQWACIGKLPSRTGLPCKLAGTGMFTHMHSVCTSRAKISWGWLGSRCHQWSNLYPTLLPRSSGWASTCGGLPFPPIFYTHNNFVRPVRLRDKDWPHGQAGFWTWVSCISKSNTFSTTTAYRVTTIFDPQSIC